MSRLVKLSSNAFYVKGRVNIGVVKIEGKLLLIDTGLDDDSARRALNLLKGLEGRLEAVINTHSHADHIGGNSFVARRTGVPIYAPEGEIPFIQNPLLEPALLYGGYPPPPLTKKLFMAKPSKARPLTSLEIGGLEIHRLPGHSPDMIGIAVGDVFYIADAVFPEGIVKKHKILYGFDPERMAESLRTLMRTDYKIYLPSHGSPTGEIEELIDLNLAAIENVKNKVLAVLEEGAKSTQTLIGDVLEGLGLKYEDPGMYMLNASALKGYLSWLTRNGKITCFVEKNIVMWALK